MRAVGEWKGRTHDTPIPPRVRLRIFERFAGHCADCTRRLGGSLRPDYDHVRALINGGENRESNLQLLCSECHKKKSGADVGEKSAIYRKKIKRLGLKRGRKILGSRGSGFRKKMDGTVVRE